MKCYFIRTFSLALFLVLPFSHIQTCWLSYLSYFILLLFLRGPVCFLMKDKRSMDLDDSGYGEKLGGKGRRNLNQTIFYGKQSIT